MDNIGEEAPVFSFNLNMAGGVWKEGLIHDFHDTLFTKPCQIIDLYKNKKHNLI